MVLVDQSIPKLFFCHLSIQKKRYINNRINFLQTMGFLILIHNSLEFWIMTFKKMYRIKSVDRLWLQTVRLHLRNRKLQEYYCSKNKKVWIIFRTPTFFFFVFTYIFTVEPHLVILRECIWFCTQKLLLAGSGVYQEF